MRQVLAAIIAMAVPAVAALADPAQTPGSDIVIATCHAQLDKPPLRIAYKSTSPKTAGEVDFAIVDSVGLVETVRDVGKFESGTPINHVFALPPDVSPLGLSSARCIVTKVVYADGTTWINPSSP